MKEKIIGFIKSIFLIWLLLTSSILQAYPDTEGISDTDQKEKAKEFFYKGKAEALSLAKRDFKRQDYYNPFY